MLKPDAVFRGLIGEIFSRFERKDFVIRNMMVVDPDLSPVVREKLQAHYAEFADKSFYGELMTFLCSGPIVIAILYGNIDVARQLVGSTNPSDAEAGSIRGDYACSLPRNLIHCSHSNVDAVRENELWSDIFIKELTSVSSPL